MWNPFFLTFLAFSFFRAGQAHAHASEQGLVLLLPTGAYTVAGTATVIASIVMVTCMSRTVLSKLFEPIELGGGHLRGFTSAPIFVSFISSLLFLALVFIGLRGPTDPQNNLLPLTIWTVWWGGVFIVQGTVFDIWKWVNPWTGFAEVFGLGQAPKIRLPAWLASWPAVVTLICFQLFLLADIAPSDPRRLATVVMGYWLFTLIGIELCGKDEWLARVECFSVMFRLIGSLRPFQWKQGLRVGLPGWAALARPQLDLSRAAFCLVVLTGGSFDGVNETFWWLAQIGINPLAFPGRSAVVMPTIIGLLVSIALLFFLLGLAVWLGLKIVERRKQSEPIPFLRTFKAFAVTLLPIALGYHFAHYVVSFMVQIKFTLSTASDPMALGWNLFGLGAVKATVGFLSIPETVKAIWLTQASVVVFSHVIAVLMGHHVANKLYCDNRDVVLVQIGLTVLMIAYTVFGLWLLASPRGA